MNKSLVVATLLATTTIACSAADDAENVFPTPKEDAFVTASEQTKRELGIVRWGVTKDPATRLAVMHGYAANDEPLVELRHETKIIDDDHVDIEIELSGSRGTGEMRIGFESHPAEDPEETAIEIAVKENSFAQSDTRRVLDRMSADTGEGATILGAGQMANTGGSLVGETLAPTDAELVRRCASLAASCGWQVVRTGASTVWNTQTCRSALVSRGISLLCRWIGGQIGKRAGGAVGAVGGPVGIAVGAAVGQEVGSELADRGCRWAFGNSREEEQRNTRDCVAATVRAAGETWNGNPECQSARAECTGR